MKNHRRQPSILLQRRLAFSLLEVMLALSILGVSTAILSRILQLGTDNGLRARRITQAQMLCESKLNEAVLGSVPLQSTSWTPITQGAANQEWSYSVQVIAAEQKNLNGVVISINDAQGIKQNSRPLAKLVQWIIDPSLGLDAKSTTTTGTSTSSSSSSNASGSKNSSQGTR